MTKRDNRTLTRGERAAAACHARMHGRKRIACIRYAPKLSRRQPVAAPGSASPGAQLTCHPTLNAPRPLRKAVAASKSAVSRCRARRRRTWTGPAPLRSAASSGYASAPARSPAARFPRHDRPAAGARRPRGSPSAGTAAVWASVMGVLKRVGARAWERFLGGIAACGKARAGTPAVPGSPRLRRDGRDIRASPWRPSRRAKIPPMYIRSAN